MGRNSRAPTNSHNEPNARNSKLSAVNKFCMMILHTNYMRCTLKSLHSWPGTSQMETLLWIFHSLSLSFHSFRSARYACYVHTGNWTETNFDKIIKIDQFHSMRIGRGVHTHLNILPFHFAFYKFSSENLIFRYVLAKYLR